MSWTAARHPGCAPIFGSSDELRDVVQYSLPRRILIEPMKTSGDEAKTFRRLGILGATGPQGERDDSRNGPCSSEPWPTS